MVTLAGGHPRRLAERARRTSRRSTGSSSRRCPSSRVASYASTGDKTFVSDDGRTTFALVYPQPDPDSAFGENPQAEKAASAALKGATVAGQPVHLTGFDALFEDSGADSEGPGLLLEALLGGLGALAVLTFVFASFLAIVPIFMAVVSIMTTFLLLLGLTELTSVSPIVQFLIALLGLGVAIDYSLIVVSRWREERSHGRSGDEAVQKAMETAGRAVVFSGITVAIGLLALIALPLPFLRSMGYGGMLIPLVSTLVAITLLPVVLAKVGLAARLAAPAHRRQGEPRLDALGRGRSPAAAGSPPAPAWRSSWRSCSPPPTCSSAPPTPTRSPSRATPRTGLVALEEAGHRRGRAASARDPDRGRHRSRTRWRAPSPSVDGIHGAVAPDSPQWRRDGTALVEAIPIPDSGSDEGEATLDGVRDAAHAAGPDVRVGGQPAANADFIDAVYGSFPLMIALITITTFILLARAFRSLLLPAKAIMLNILSVAAAWGVLVLVWQHGYGSELIWGIEATGSIPSWMPLMIFAFLFGLSMDYEVFILVAHARGVRPHRLDRAGGDHGHRAHRAARDERGADPVPDVRRDGLRPGHGPEDVRHRPGRRDPARRDGDPGADRARGDRADGPLELVAARVAGAAAARGAVGAQRRRVATGEGEA